MLGAPNCQKLNPPRNSFPMKYTVLIATKKEAQLWTKIRKQQASLNEARRAFINSQH
jgi:hypothetical protein